MSTDAMSMLPIPEGGLAADRSCHLVDTAVFFMILCTIFVILRFVAHRVADSAIFFDDWLIIPAYVLMMGLCIDLILSAKLGDAGRHEAWVVQNEPTAMPKFAQTLFAMEILYSLAIAIGKTSILLLYYRIFGVQRGFRMFIWAMVIFLWMWALAETIISVVQCTPVAYQWDKSLDGACIDQLATYRYIPLPNVVHDVVLLALPTPMIWQLQKVSIHQKLALTLVFLIGSFGCIASMIRTYYMFMLGDMSTSDQTWQMNNLIWTIAEPGSILVCACLPVLWPMVRRALRLPSEPTRIEGKPGTTVLLPRGWWRPGTTSASSPPRKARKWDEEGGGGDQAAEGGGYHDARDYDLKLVHGVAAPEVEVDRRADHHDHLYLGPIRYQVKQDPRMGVPNTRSLWDASRGSPARAV